MEFYPICFTPVQAELKKNAAKEEDGAGKGKRKVSDSASELDETPKKRKIPFKDEVKPTPPKKKMDKEEIKMKVCDNVG